MTIERGKLIDSLLGDFTLIGSPECNFRFLYLPEGWTGRSFEACAKNAGVQVYCGERFAVGSSEVPPAIRIAITAPRTMEEFREGLMIIRGLLTRVDEFTML